MEIIFIVILSVVAGFFIYKTLRNKVSTLKSLLEFIYLGIFVLSLFLFGVGIKQCHADYTTAIDIVDRGYTPFGRNHVPTLLVFSALAFWSAFKLLFHRKTMPPIPMVLCMVFVLIGIGISIAVLLQISSNTAFDDGWLFAFLPAIFIVSSIVLLIKVISGESQAAIERKYQNRMLNYLNVQMAKANLQPVWALLLLVPVFLVITAVLVLFGQDAHAITKVFTETTTWKFSQQTHPPFLDHRGHYLCTVAACGDPKVVKPIRLGQRHGHEIIVNRQLQIANAFEELIQEQFPSAHRFIRRIYDQYGYPLSTKITTKSGSNLAYQLMKPLEYFFLIVLYSCSRTPEIKISKQYSSPAEKPDH